MRELELYSVHSLDDQLWYVAHPVHPTDEDVAGLRAGWTSWGYLHFSDAALRAQVVKNNIANAKAWLGWLIRAFPAITFIAPWIAALDGGGDDDLVPEQRQRGLRDCCRTISRCDGMVLVGGRVSGGMSREAASARRVIDLTGLGRVPPRDDAHRFVHAPSSEDSR